MAIQNDGSKRIIRFPSAEALSQSSEVEGPNNDSPSPLELELQEVLSTIQGRPSTSSASLSVRQMMTALTSMLQTGLVGNIPPEFLAQMLQGTSGVPVTDLVKAAVQGPEAVSKLLEVSQPKLIGYSLQKSGKLRWYQGLAKEAFCAGRGAFQNRVAQIPTGGGKTAVAMTTMEDILPELKTSERLIVTVPDAAEQSRWAAELCTSDFGLKMPRHLVFVGTAKQLEHHLAVCAKNGLEGPKVVVMTQAGIRTANRGDGLSDFLQRNGIVGVVQDEFHNFVKDPSSASAATAKALATLTPKQLRYNVAVSGTLQPKEHEALRAMGYRLVLDIPKADLIASGAIAPFARLTTTYGAPEQAQTIQLMVEQLGDYAKQLGSLIDKNKLRALAGELVQQGQLEALVKAHLQVRDQQGDTKTQARLTTRWQNLAKGEGALASKDLDFFSALATHQGWSDLDIITNLGKSHKSDSAELPSYSGAQAKTILDDVRSRFSAIRKATKGLEIHRLFGGLDTRTFGTDPSHTSLLTLARDAAAWSYPADIDRDVVIRSLIKAQTEARKAEGSVRFTQDGQRQMLTLVFDRPTQVLDLPKNNAVIERPESGALSTYLGLLSDPNRTPVAALRKALYLPNADRGKMQKAVEEHARRKARTTGKRTASGLLSGLGQVPLKTAEALTALVKAELVKAANTSRPSSNSTALTKLHRDIEFVLATNESFRALPEHARSEVLRRLSDVQREGSEAQLGVIEMMEWAELAHHVQNAPTAKAKNPHGKGSLNFVVVEVPRGSREDEQIRRKIAELVTELAERPELGIDTVVLDDERREGWSVRRPVLGIDVAPPNDPNKDDQTLGRLLRAPKAWSNDCTKLVQSLLGFAGANADMFPDLSDAARKTVMLSMPAIAPKDQLSTPELKVLQEVLSIFAGQKELPPFARDGDLSGLSNTERLQLAKQVFSALNQVATHITLISSSGIKRDEEGNLALSASLAKRYQNGEGANTFTGDLAKGAEQRNVLEPSVRDDSDFHRHFLERTLNAWLGFAKTSPAERASKKTPTSELSRSA